MVGSLAVNCYIVGCPERHEAIIIDPGGDYRKVLRVLNEGNLRAIAILNTHGHADHIGANDKFNLPVWIHRLDKEFLKDPKLNLSSAFFLRITSGAASRLLEDGDSLEVGEVGLSVIHTPGHTPGSICISAQLEGLAHWAIFTGDTLFAGGVGRTDFPYSSEGELYRSINERLFKFPDSTVIYPGHGPDSTIGAEKRWMSK